MIASVNSNIPSAAVVKRQIEKGYKERRDFLVARLLRMLIGYTPVDSGEARGSWRVSGGGPATNHVKRLDPDGDATYAEQVAILQSIPAFGDVHLSNTAPHFPSLERGHSGQAPAGVLRVIVPAFNAIFEDVR